MKPTVMFVDDQAEVLSGLTRILKKEPYDTVTCLSPFRALEILDSQQVQVIVSDFQMPGMNGITFLSEVRKRFPNSVRIMLTGNGDLDVAREAINKGEIYRFFTKPCNEIELGIAIRQSLEHRILLNESKRLLDLVKMQSNFINHLEKEHPGIFDVERDSNGAVLISDENSDLTSVVREVEAEIEKQEHAWFATDLADSIKK